MKTLPIRWRELKKEDKELVITNYFDSPLFDFIQYENGLVIPRYYAEKMADRVFNLEVKKDDIWVVSYPKAGTTLTLELVWHLINNKQELATTPHLVRCPFLEANATLREGLMDSSDPDICEILHDSIAYVDNKEGRRVIKTHLPFEFLPPDLFEKCKVIYVSRNPKDVALSYYHFASADSVFSGSTENFMEMFMKGIHCMGHYFTHLLSGWKMKDHPNVKFVWYEELQADLVGVIRDMSIFLEHSITQENTKTLAKSLKFENMKKCPNITPTAGINLSADKYKFMRKGVVGDWKNHEIMKSRDWDDWIQKQVAGTGFEQLQLFKKF